MIRCIVLGFAKVALGVSTHKTGWDSRNNSRNESTHSLLTQSVPVIDRDVQVGTRNRVCGRSPPYALDYTRAMHLKSNHTELHNTRSARATRPSHLSTTAELSGAAEKPPATSSDISRDVRALIALHCSRTSPCAVRRMVLIDSSPLCGRAMCVCRSRGKVYQPRRFVQMAVRTYIQRTLCDLLVRLCSALLTLPEPRSLEAATPPASRAAQRLQ